MLSSAARCLRSPVISAATGAAGAPIRAVAAPLVSRAWATTAPRLSAASARAFSAESATFEGEPTVNHLIEPEDGPGTSYEATKDELMEYFETMFTIRRMEIAADSEYKKRNIRGFCHLYDGQEAVAMGIEAGLTREDSITTAYRCHGFAVVRGDTVDRIMAEMYGFFEGSSKGKGGSMHLYNKSSNYWGGSGIVGAQVPVGTGVAFANRYLARMNDTLDNMPVSVSLFGDGAANQGQIWEAANMAKLWKLPAIFIVENNAYGMGTSVARHSSNPDYYMMGGTKIPGIKVDGMDVLAVREAIRWAKEFSGSGNGPLFVDMKTYRYHGHSMSDPGITYRSRDEVSGVRKTRDCIEAVKQKLIDNDWATASGLKKVEKRIRGEVDAAVAKAQSGSLPPIGELYTDIYAEGPPEYIRGNEYATSVGAKW